MAGPQKSEYKILAGNAVQIDQQLAVLASQNWRPILMSTNQAQGGPVAITIVLEHILGT